MLSSLLAANAAALSTFEVTCESIMLICFGISWPISVYKSIKSRSTKGKSAVFIVAIIIGYIAAIAGKTYGLINFGRTFNLGFALAIINLVVVSIDLVLFFINKRYEKKQEALKAEEENKENK